MIRAADASQQPIRFATLIKVRHAVFTRNNVSEQLFCVNDFVLYLAHCRQTPRQLLAPWLSKKRKRIAGGLVGIVVSVSAEALRSGQDVALFEANGVELLPQHAKAQTFYASSNVLLSLLFMHSRPGTVLYRLVTERLLTHAAVETQLSVSGEDLTALECEKTTYRRAKRIATTEKDSQPNEATICDSCQEEKPFIGRVVGLEWFCGDCRSVSLPDTSEATLQRPAMLRCVPNLGQSCALSAAFQLLCATPGLYTALQRMPPLGQRCHTSTRDDFLPSDDAAAQTALVADLKRLVMKRAAGEALVVDDIVTLTASLAEYADLRLYNGEEMSCDEVLTRLLNATIAGTRGSTIESLVSSQQTIVKICPNGARKPIDDVPTVLLELIGANPHDINDDSNINDADNQSENDASSEAAASDDDVRFKREMLCALDHCDLLPADLRCEDCTHNNTDDDTLHRKHSLIATLPPVLFVLRKVRRDGNETPSVAQTNAQLEQRGAISLQLRLPSTNTVRREPSVTQRRYQLFGFVVRSVSLSIFSFFVSFTPKQNKQKQKTTQTKNKSNYNTHPP